MADFFLPIASKKYETADVISVCFETKAAAVNFQAGQFVRLTLPGVANDARGSSRFFSLASSPTEKNFIMIATKISESPFKQQLAKLAVGEVVNISGPFGKFVLTNTASKQHVFLSGGIGITPFRSMLKYATDKKLPHKIVLLYSNQTPEDVVFKEDLEKIAAENPNITIVNTITRPETSNNATLRQGLRLSSVRLSSPPKPAERPQGKQLHNNNLIWEAGRIDKAMISKFARDIPNSIFYICGPPSMVETLATMVKDMGISDEHLKLERFTGYQ